MGILFADLGVRGVLRSASGAKQGLQSCEALARREAGSVEAYHSLFLANAWPEPDFR